VCKRQVVYTSVYQTVGFGPLPVSNVPGEADYYFCKKFSTEMNNKFSSKLKIYQRKFFLPLISSSCFYISYICDAKNFNSLVSYVSKTESPRTLQYIILNSVAMLFLL